MDKYDNKDVVIEIVNPVELNFDKGWNLNFSNDDEWKIKFIVAGKELWI